LTDEQIAIFRHSEIQALLRDRRHAAEAKQDKEDEETEENSREEQIEDVLVQEAMVEEQGQGEAMLEDGELDDEADTPTTEMSSYSPVTKGKKSKNKGQKAQKNKVTKQKSFFKQHVKPDLRKRTWDKVDTGLESLDYDEGESGVASTRPIQRRRISYKE
jgi:Protein of unknown function (DUF3807)